MAYNFPPTNLATIITAQGKTQPVAASYTTSLTNVADIAYNDADGLGVQKVFAEDSISIRYTTAVTFGSGLTAIARIRGSADVFGGPCLVLREAATGVCQTVICRINGQTWRNYQFNATQAWVIEAGASTAMVQRDISDGWWFKAYDDTVNLNLYVSYDSNPNGEPPTTGWRLLWTQGRRLYNGNAAGLGAAGWTQVGVGAYGFGNGAAGAGAVLESIRVA